MITSPSFAGRRYAVLGLARSGMATVEALLASGAEVLAWDRNPDACKALADRHSAALGTQLFLDDFSDWQEFECDALVLSPGVPLNRHPLAEAARRQGIPIIGDIELFALARAHLPPHKVVGITGTNGKSTTTALMHHICAVAGLPTIMGGNIGLPILAQEPLPAGGVYVLELSSYQIDLTYSLDCDVAVLLNITPDHLDRYDGFEAYKQSKLRLFGMQTEPHAAILADADEDLLQHILDLPTGPGALSLQPEEPNFGVHDQADFPTLQGPHNAQNIWAAATVAQHLGISAEALHEALRTYPGLPHRMERIGEFGGVLFVNDSKATNPASTAPALSAYPRIHWIVGGLPKGDDLDECAPGFPHVVRAYAIGEAGPRFADILAPHMPVERAEMMCEAVRRAIAHAQPGEVVLLSPACASFDQFRDYEKRGDAFREIVLSLTSGADDACCDPEHAA